MLCYQCVAFFRLVQNWETAYGRKGDKNLLINPLPSIVIVLLIICSIFAAIPIDLEMIQRRICGACSCCSTRLQFASLMRAPIEMSNGSFHALSPSQVQSQQSENPRFRESFQQSSQINSFKPQILLNDNEIRLCKSDSVHISRSQFNNAQHQLSRLTNNPPELAVLPASCTPSPTINERISQITSSGR